MHFMLSLGPRHFAVQVSLRFGHVPGILLGMAEAENNRSRHAH